MESLETSPLSVSARRCAQRHPVSLRRGRSCGVRYEWFLALLCCSLCPSLAAAQFAPPVSTVETSPARLGNHAGVPAQAVSASSHSFWRGAAPAVYPTAHPAAHPTTNSPASANSNPAPAVFASDHPFWRGSAPAAQPRGNPPTPASPGQPAAPCGTNCGYNTFNLPPQPDGIPSGCNICITGIDCANSPYPQTWKDRAPINFAPLYHGEHIGPVRLPSVQQYRVRVGDRLRFVFVLSREGLVDQYRLMANDEVMIESITDATLKQGDLTRGIPILADGMIYLKIVGPIRAEGLTIPQLRRNIETAYTTMLKAPAIDVTPVRTNTALEDLRNAVDARFGAGGQSISDTVHPDGTISLPKLGPVCVQGLTLQEVKREINLRYREIVTGLEVEPFIDQEAPHFVYVYGEVGRPDRYELVGPTTVAQALAMAQGVKPGGNIRQIVVFRRAEDWRLLATRLDIRGELLGKVPTPADDIWLRDNDLIIVPPTPIRLFDNFVRQVFTEGIYGIVPFGGISISQLRGGSISSN
jgi:polysaccharide biosynthesis/export protein